MHMFISEPHKGFYYIAEKSPVAYCKYLWSIMPVAPTAADTRIEARKVPYHIRRAAYRLFHADRNREQPA